MRIPIVDEYDTVITIKDRSEVIPTDIYRVAALWLRNVRGEILLARRALTKSHDPGKWGPAVAGTVEENETYESNIAKEIVEELGIHNIRIFPGPKQLVQGRWKFFDQWFTATVNLKIEDFSTQKNEVAEIAWFPTQIFRQQLEEHPENFLASMKSLPPEFYQ